MWLFKTFWTGQKSDRWLSVSCFKSSSSECTQTPCYCRTIHLFPPSNADEKDTEKRGQLTAHLASVSSLMVVGIKACLQHQRPSGQSRTARHPPASQNPLLQICPHQGRKVSHWQARLLWVNLGLVERKRREEGGSFLYCRQSQDESWAMDWWGKCVSFLHYTRL